ncbi:3-hydroxyisobutyrate dehydrogenase, mitochondrial-like [Dendronephthya gigantea]|uniref:3-hydroxyisobutyrate dehydrogenase, mitochondrial-like n=1 Tax=Dendronephthya gigantea TaxID=151771 RepID=UPI00106D9670|nr:3-hydroxyisobutyrate dehydrogenase, mitochondrial-like [Dendronephthya gigantea]
MSAVLTKKFRYLLLAGPRQCRFVARFLSSERSEDKGPHTIGFIGLGNMGGPMAKNLLKNSHKLIVSDVVSSSIEELQKEGADVSENPADIASKTSIIITMLPSSPNVSEVYLGKNGIIETVQEGSLLIDSSTINPEVAKEVALKAKEKSATFLDAPVSGGVMASQNGTLSFLVGGSKTGFERAKPILQCMGQNIFHCGGTATGQAVKICNNLLLAISMIGTSEAMNLGQNLGLDPKLLADVINKSSGRCWSSELYNPCPGVLENVPSTNHYQGGFGTALMTKDLGLAQEAATSTKSATPLGSLAHQIYRIMCNRGYGHLDFSSAYKFLKEEE